MRTSPGSWSFWRRLSNPKLLLRVCLAVVGLGITGASSGALAEATPDQSQAYVAKAVESNYWTPPCVPGRFGFTVPGKSCKKYVYQPQLKPVLVPLTYWYQQVSGVVNAYDSLEHRTVMSEDRWCSQEPRGDSESTRTYKEEVDSTENGWSVWLDPSAPTFYGPSIWVLLNTQAIGGTKYYPSWEYKTVEKPVFLMKQKTSDFTFFQVEKSGAGIGRIAFRAEELTDWDYVEVISKPRSSKLKTRVRSWTFNTSTIGFSSAVLRMPESRCNMQFAPESENWHYLAVPKTVGRYVFQGVTVSKARWVCSIYNEDVCSWVKSKKDPVWRLSVDVKKNDVVIRTFKAF
jgi:hypothetical protein